MCVSLFWFFAAVFGAAMFYMSVSENRGKTPKWMVKIMENPIKLDDLGGKPTLFLETPICTNSQIHNPSNHHFPPPKVKLLQAHDEHRDAPGILCS